MRTPTLGHFGHCNDSSFQTTDGLFHVIANATTDAFTSAVAVASAALLGPFIAPIFTFDRAIGVRFLRFSLHTTHYSHIGNETCQKPYIFCYSLWATSPTGYAPNWWISANTSVKFNHETFNSLFFFLRFDTLCTIHGGVHRGFSFFMA